MDKNINEILNGAQFKIAESLRIEYENLCSEVTSNSEREYGPDIPAWLSGFGSYRNNLVIVRRYDVNALKIGPFILDGPVFIIHQTRDDRVEPTDPLSKHINCDMRVLAQISNGNVVKADITSQLNDMGLHFYVSNETNLFTIKSTAREVKTKYFSPNDKNDNSKEKSEN